MSRVIQDSDDDLDDDLEVEAHQSEARDASLKQSASDASSTEALRKQIEAVHRAHLQSQTAVNDNETPKTLEEAHQKRKAPTEFDLHDTSERIYSAKKAFVEYSSKTKGVFAGLPQDFRQDQPLNSHISQPVDQVNATGWILEGTMRESYARHNPNAMFAEPSSTVPNATLTQQRVMEGLLAPALLGSDIDTGGTPFQPDASIPWSEYLKSPTDPGEHPKSSPRRSQVSQSTPACQTDKNPPKLSVSQTSLRMSMTPVGCPPTQDMFIGKTDTQHLILSPADEAVSDPMPMQGTFSTTCRIQRGTTTCSSQEARRKKRSPSPKSASDDDLVHLGLPKEQYKPRPSRSRSLKVATQASIDYSVRPEKPTKVSRRRKSTPATTSHTNTLSTPDRVQQICETGFTPSTSAKALEQNNGDVTQSVDWLITNRVADDELVSHASQMSTSGNNEVGVNFNTRETLGNLNVVHGVDEHAMPTDLKITSNLLKKDLVTTQTNPTSPVADLKSPAKVQVVIPAKLSNSAIDVSAPPLITYAKVRRRKTTKHPEPIATEDAATVIRGEKKRGRGRPKKAARTSLAATTMHEEDEKNSKEQVCHSSLLTVNGNAQPDVVQQPIKDTEISKTTKSVQESQSSQLEEANTKILTPKSTPELQQLPDRPEVEPITPKHVKETAPRDQLSNNKAKVLYRVGLSRRTKIAPLLRVIKK